MRVSVHPPFPPNVECKDIPNGLQINVRCIVWQACVMRCAWLDRAAELEVLQKESWHHYLDEYALKKNRSKRLMKMWRDDSRKFFRDKAEALANAEAWRVWGLQKNV